MKRLLAAFLVLLCFALPAHAALSINGTCKVGNIPATAANTISSAATVGYTSGDVVVAAVGNTNQGGAPFTVTGVAGGTGLSAWQKLTSASVSGSSSVGDKGDLEFWWASAASTQSNQTITATISGSAPAGTITVCSISGADTTTPADGAAVSANNVTGSSTAPSVTISTTNANTVLFAVGMTIGSSWNSGSPPTAPSTFTQQAFASGFNLTSFLNQDVDTETKIVSATQSSLAITWGTATTQWLALAIAIKAPGAAPSGQANPLTMMGVGP